MSKLYVSSPHYGGNVGGVSYAEIDHRKLMLTITIFCSTDLIDDLSHEFRSSMHSTMQFLAVSAAIKVLQHLTN